MLRLHFLEMPELAIASLTSVLQEVLADRKVQLVIAGLLLGQHVRRQLARCPKVLLFALRAVEELAPRPSARPVLEVVAEGVLLRLGRVIAAFVQVLAPLAPVADVAQKVPAHPSRGRLPRTSDHPDSKPWPLQLPLQLLTLRFSTTFDSRSIFSPAKQGWLLRKRKMTESAPSSREGKVNEEGVVC